MTRRRTQSTKVSNWLLASAEWGVRSVELGAGSAECGILKHEFL